MVQLRSVEEDNAAFKEQKHAGLVCVFLGATHGIGEATCEVVASLLMAPTFYIIGRSAARFEEQRARLKRVNPDCKINFLLTEASLISGIDHVSRIITAAESRVDYLFMSCGYLPLNGPVGTKEGLETCFALSYWSRMRLLNNLLPLLQASSRPRVLSVLNGGREGRLYDKDLALVNSWSVFRLVANTSTMTTLVFHLLAESHTKITFIHSAPGLVRTQKGRRMSPATYGKLWMIVVRLLRWLMASLGRFRSMSVEESGQRNAFQLTSNEFGPGFWRLDKSCDVCPTSDVIEEYRQAGWPARLWDLTVATWERARQTGESAGS